MSRDSNRDPLAAERKEPLTPMQLTMAVDQLGVDLGKVPNIKPSTVLMSYVVAFLALLFGAGSLIMSMQHTSAPPTDPRVGALIVSVDSLRTALTHQPVPADSASVAAFNERLELMIAELEGVHQREEQFQRSIDLYGLKK